MVKKSLECSWLLLLLCSWSISWGASRDQPLPVQKLPTVFQLPQTRLTVELIDLQMRKEPRPFLRIRTEAEVGHPRVNWMVWRLTASNEGGGKISTSVKLHG